MIFLCTAYDDCYSIVYSFIIYNDNITGDLLNIHLLLQ